MAVPDLRLDPAPAPLRGAPHPAAADAEVRAPSARRLAGELRALLTDPAFRDPALREERAAVRYAAEGFALALRSGTAPDLPAAAAVVRAATDARDARVRRAAGDAELGRLRAVRADLAAADPHAGPRALAFARGALADVRDLAAAADPFTPDRLFDPEELDDPAASALAGGRLAGWVCVQFRTLCGAAEPLVVATLARDGGVGPDADDRAAALLSLAGLPAAAARACGHRRERPDGGGPRRVPGDALTAGDRLVAWCDRFVDLAAAGGFAEAAAATYAAGRRGELCLSVAAAGLEALGLHRGGQGAADSAGVAPVALALTDLGRTRLRLDAAHPLPAPRYAAAPAGVRSPAVAGARR